jgi:CubicO group peptidase (beta-lactamase class C family)
MTSLQVEVDPEKAGFDAGRLARIDRHFTRYVDDGRLPGWLLLVSRDGGIAHLSTYGRRDVEADLPVELDTRFRIYSMTKPVTSVAAMMLFEEGAFQLKDPVARFIPSFADARVYRGGTALAATQQTEPVTEPVRVWHLLTHTAGLTYGFHHAHPVDEMYRAAGFEWTTPDGLDLASCCGPGPASRCCSSRAASGTTRSPATCSAGSSRWPRGSRWTGSSPSAFSSRWA